MSMTKIEGSASGSGSRSIRHGSADPDPYLNVMDPQHCENPIITIYAPMIYTAPCVMLLMRADTLRGEVVGGLALEISSFVGPCEMARADRRVPFVIFLIFVIFVIFVIFSTHKKIFFKGFLLFF
jgi:hypothetical protein